MNGYFSLPDNTKFADVRVQQAYGQRGLGFFRLAVQVVAAMDPRPEKEKVVVSALSAELYVRNGSGMGPLIGRMAPRGSDVPFQSLEYKHDQWVTFDLDLDGARVEAIETVRAGRDLDLLLRLEGAAETPDGKGPHRLHTDLHFTATQSDWVKVLDNMGYRKTLLLEIPMPDSEAPEELRQAIEHLREAQDLMIHGRNREAVGACRDVLESLETALADANAAAPDNQRDWNKACRVRHVRRALKVLTHPARHADEVSTRHEWGPVDARAIVTATAALLRLATQD